MLATKEIVDLFFFWKAQFVSRIVLIYDCAVLYIMVIISRDAVLGNSVLFFSVI